MNQDANTNKEACRPWWQNCGVEADAEMLEIDTMEDAMAFCGRK